VACPPGWGVGEGVSARGIGFQDVADKEGGEAALEAVVRPTAQFGKSVTADARSLSALRSIEPRPYCRARSKAASIFATALTRSADAPDCSRHRAHAHRF
jgi:hypothetical protein